MSLVVGDNFSLLSKKPLDGRIKYDTLAAMVAMADDTLYEGCIAYCAENDKNYQWKSTNPIDETTGRWHEFSSGGGGTITVDDEISGTSENPVQNKVIKAALDGKEDTLTFDSAPTENSNNPVKSGGVYTALSGKANAADLADVATSGEYADLDNLPDIPEKVSDLTNDSGFIDNTINNLVNYYTKQQTYTQAEVQALISAAASGGFEVVASLPAEGDTHTIYLVLKSPAGETGDIYDEYIYVTGAWEHIGSTSIDLTQYQTKALVNSITVGGVQQTTVEGALAAINALFASYMTTAAFNTAIADYYTKTQADALLNSKVDWDAQDLLGAKNLLYMPSQSGIVPTSGGANYVVDADTGTITLSGWGYDGRDNGYVDVGTITEPGSYILSGEFSKNDKVWITMTLSKEGETSVSYTSHGEDVAFTLTTGWTGTLSFNLGRSQSFDGYIIRPMIRYSTVTDSEFATYSKTNKQLTADKQEKQLDTPLTIGGTSRTSVEDALGALNNSKQDNLVFDDAPTSGSNNPVKSDGLYAYIGALTSLATTVKTSIVAAINELVTALNGKQDTMSAGTGITLTNSGKTINATNTLPLNYSTSEQVVGTWIDSKPLYQKTISFTAQIGTNTFYTFSEDVTIRSLSGIIDWQSGVTRISYYGGPNNFAEFYSLKNPDVLGLQLPSNSPVAGGTAYATVQYTKAAD